MSPTNGSGERGVEYESRSESLGRAVAGSTGLNAMENLGLEDIDEVRVGKLVRLNFGEVSELQALELSEEACKKLLANPVIEDFKIELLSGENGK